MNTTKAKEYGLAPVQVRGGGRPSRPRGNERESRTGFTNVRAHLLSSLNLADFVVSVPSSRVREVRADRGERQDPGRAPAPRRRGQEDLAQDRPGGARSRSRPSRPPRPAAPTFSPATSFQYRNVGVNLDITPKVNPSGDISLELTAEFSLLGKPTTLAGQDLPTFLTRNVDGGAAPARWRDEPHRWPRPALGDRQLRAASWACRAFRCSTRSSPRARRRCRGQRDPDLDHAPHPPRAQGPRGRPVRPRGGHRGDPEGRGRAAAALRAAERRAASRSRADPPARTGSRRRPRRRRRAPRARPSGATAAAPPPRARGPRSGRAHASAASRRPSRRAASARGCPRRRGPTVDARRSRAQLSPPEVASRWERRPPCPSWSWVCATLTGLEAVLTLDAGPGGGGRHARLAPHPRRGGVGAERAFEAGRVRVKLTRPTGVSGSGVVLVRPGAWAAARATPLSIESLSSDHGGRGRTPAVARPRPGSTVNP